MMVTHRDDFSRPEAGHSAAPGDQKLRFGVDFYLQLIMVACG